MLSIELFQRWRFMHKLHSFVIKRVSFLKSFSPEAEKMTKTNIRKKIWVIWLSQKIFSMCLSAEIKSGFKICYLATWASGPVMQREYCRGFLHFTFLQAYETWPPPLFVWIPTRSNGSKSLMLRLILFDSFLSTLLLLSNTVFLLLRFPHSFSLTLSHFRCLSLPP